MTPQELFDKHYRWCRNLVIKRFRIPISVSKQDYMVFVNAGLIGLWKAAKAYKEDLKTEFKAFAYMKVIGSVVDCIRDETNYRRVGFKEEKRTVSTEHITRDIEGVGFVPRHIARMDKNFDRFEAKEFTENALRKLKPQVLEVIRLYYFEDQTLEQIGKHINKSEARVMQIVHEALERMRKIS